MWHLRKTSIGKDEIHVSCLCWWCNAYAVFSQGEVLCSPTYIIVKIIIFIEKVTHVPNYSVQLANCSYLRQLPAIDQLLSDHFVDRF